MIVRKKETLQQASAYSSYAVLLLYSICILLITACSYSKEPETFSDKNLSIQYPSWLSVAHDIYPTKNTLLQAKNDYRDVFFILIDHGMKPGDNGFDIMCDSIVGQLRKNLKEPNTEQPDTTFITSHQLKVREYLLSGVESSKQQDHRFLFVIDIFETKDGHIYQTAGWMLRNKRQLWLKDIQKAAYSLQVQKK